MRGGEDSSWNPQRYLPSCVKHHQPRRRSNRSPSRSFRSSNLSVDSLLTRSWAPCSYRRLMPFPARYSDSNSAAASLTFIACLPRSPAVNCAGERPSDAFRGPTLGMLTMGWQPAEKAHSSRAGPLTKRGLRTTVSERWKQRGAKPWGALRGASAYTIIQPASRLRCPAAMHGCRSY